MRSTVSFLVAGAAFVLLSACSGSPAAPQVATLDTGSASAGAPASSTTTANTDADAGRPQLRLDSSPDERQAYWDAYDSCLRTNGHAVLNGRSTHSGPVGGPGSQPALDMNDDSPQSKKAEEVCKGKLPLQPPELSPRTNPKFNDQFHDMVKCMTDKGAHVHVAPDTSVDPDGLTWQIDDGSSDTYDNLDKLADDCQLQAFSK
ncbi:hypothetical protein VSH64_44665 [Amycolatopsis rhabdoformis]|uniref:Secreted protein n=1 Tax=Amycolatopsis rhabdoformis TaxID=1448059 RepID=A0ABZ1I680_9PSEU|nr:hypothetical protein [Amycolatopsis rhabdoformis]WSE29810.1 hypothetical protein VSH64_44665 [Amycolatopsis rhabdoformis]